MAKSPSSPSIPGAKAVCLCGLEPQFPLLINEINRRLSLLQTSEPLTLLRSSNRDSVALGRLLMREKSHHHFYKIPLERARVLSPILTFFGMVGR